MLGVAALPAARRALDDCKACNCLSDRSPGQTRGKSNLLYDGLWCGTGHFAHQLGGHGRPVCSRAGRPSLRLSTCRTWPSVSGLGLLLSHVGLHGLLSEDETGVHRLSVHWPCM